MKTTEKLIRKIQKALGENYEGDDEEEFNDGDRVRLKPKWADDPNETFKVSQCDPERQRCWIGDEDGRGWYVRFYQIEHAEETEEDEYE